MVNLKRKLKLKNMNETTGNVANTEDIMPNFEFDMGENVVEDIPNPQEINENNQQTTTKEDQSTKEQKETKTEEQSTESNESTEQVTGKDNPFTEQEDSNSTKDQETETQSSQEGSGEKSDEVEGDPRVAAVFEIFKQKGYIQEDPSNPLNNTVEELDMFFNDLQNYTAQAVVNSLPEPLQKLFQFGMAKGGELQEKDLAEFFGEYQETKQQVGSIDISTEDKMEAFVKEQLIKEGKDEEDALDMIEIWKDKDKLKTYAEKYKENIESLPEKKIQKKIEETEQQAQKRQQQAIQFRNQVVDSIKSKKWSNQRKAVVFDEIYKGKINEKASTIKQHPEALIQLADFMSYFDADKGIFNMEAYKKQITGKATETVKKVLESTLSGQSAITGNQGGSMSPGSTKKDAQGEEFEFIV